MDDLFKQAELVKQRLLYHFKGTSDRWVIPPGLPFMQEFLNEVDQLCTLNMDAINAMVWVSFDWTKVETRPTECGKYLVCRKDGKVHWETWNGNGWAYNHNEIRFWSKINPPKVCT